MHGEALVSNIAWATAHVTTPTHPNVKIACGSLRPRTWMWSSSRKDAASLMRRAVGQASNGNVSEIGRVAAGAANDD